MMAAPFDSVFDSSDDSSDDALDDAMIAPTRPGSKEHILQILQPMRSNDVAQKEAENHLFQLYELLATTKMKTTVRMYLLAEDTITVILTMIDKHGTSSAQVVVNGCAALIHLTSTDNTKCGSLASAAENGIRIILNAMKKHGKSNSGVAKRGFGVLKMFSCNTTNLRAPFSKISLTNLLETIQTAEAANDCKSVVNAMKEEGESNQEVAFSGITALYNLANNNSNNKLCIASEGGIPIILNLMRCHGPSNALIAKEGCHVLSKLAANNNENRSAIATEGGISVVISMLQTHASDSLAVAKDGIFALGTLAFKNTSSKASIAAEGGIQVILGLMRSHGLNMDAPDAFVASYGCQALRNIGTLVQNQTIIAAEGGIPIILDSMRQHGGSKTEVATNGCRILRNLGGSSQNKVIINDENDGISVVEQVKASWPNNSRVRRNADEALEVLRRSL